MSTANEEAVGTLSEIPFEDVIGGPLVAAIDAQAQAASSTVDFINEVAMYQPDEEGAELQPITVTFVYENGGVQSTITVPLISIIPIPYLRIEEVVLDFKASIQATEKESEKNISVDSSGKTKVSTSFWKPKKTFKASYSTQTDIESSKSSSKLESEFNLNVHVRAIQDEIPAGMARVLGILNNSIVANVPSGRINLILATATDNLVIDFVAVDSNMKPIEGQTLEAAAFQFTGLPEGIAAPAVTAISVGETDAMGASTITMPLPTSTDPDYTFEDYTFTFSTGSQELNNGKSTASTLEILIPAG